MPQSEKNIVIALTGDVMIGRLVSEKLSNVDPSYIWGDVLPLLQEADFTFINLETALTNSEERIEKVFNFKADPYKVAALQKAHIRAVNLANNHVLDYSAKGLLETIETLDDAGIFHVGAGKNIDEAKKDIIVEIQDIKIGILGCTDNEPTWKAQKTNPGVMYVEVGDIYFLRESLLQLRKKVDILILSIHWGPNMKQSPDSSFVSFAHDLIDLGVDILHGHSAHIYQGVERYKNSLILYDTGDFVDDYYVDPLLRNDRSFLFCIECSKKGVRHLRLIPVVINNFQVNRAVGKDAFDTIQHMKFLSSTMHTDLREENAELLLDM